MKKIKVGVLGATGMVGQRFIQLLSNHPWFDLSVLTASARSAGKKYREVAKWYLETPMPEEVAEMTVVDTAPDAVKKAGGTEIAFSALPAEIADVAEPEFAKAGYIVASNASSFRMEKDVPLIIPEVNHDHLELIKVQQKNRGWSGFIITNPNCSTINLVISLKPLFDEFGIKAVIVSTMQALSGAGYEGVPSMAILDNILPYISHEEEKIQTETLKLLGTYREGQIQPANIKISASCNRVFVLDGHLETVFVELKRPAKIDEVKKAFQNFNALPQKLKLPTAPIPPIVVREEIDRPQPRLDRDAGKGMAVVVGRIRKDAVFDEGIKYLALGHNTIRGAAGASVLNAELLVKQYWKAAQTI
ncbi:MAG: aspartate-semialdehyde dehydrogenase [Euryarchaeota archaeon]|nr:aspartate-semialdehyde dehydrogenase [Euryarchaeota archaeon]